MTENQENEPEVGYHICLWFAFTLADLAVGEVMPDSWRDHIPSVDINLLCPVGVSHLLINFFSFKIFSRSTTCHHRRQISPQSLHYLSICLASLCVSQQWNLLCRFLCWGFPCLIVAVSNSSILFFLVFSNMSCPTERLPQEEENLVTLYDPKTVAPPLWWIKRLNFNLWINLPLGEIYPPLGWISLTIGYLSCIFRLTTIVWL